MNKSGSYFMGTTFKFIRTKPTQENIGQDRNGGSYLTGHVYNILTIRSALGGWAHQFRKLRMLVGFVYNVCTRVTRARM